MRTLTSKRESNITLRQYLINNSLKKRVASRTNSKEHKKSSPQHSRKQNQQFNLQNEDKGGLIQQIRIFLAENIHHQIKLSKILKMFDKLIQLYNRELQNRNDEYDLLSTMIRQKPARNNSSHFTLAERPINKKVYTQPQQLVGEQVEQKRVRKNSIIEVYNYVGDSRSSSNSQIPNINILLQTRHPFKDLQTQETVNGKQSNLQESRISIQFDYDYHEQNSLTTSKHNHTNTNNTSRNSSFQMLTGSFRKDSESKALSRFQQFKRKVVK